MFAIGVAQVAVGGVLIGLASSGCGDADCRTAHQIMGGVAVPVIVVGAVFALTPGAILWGWGNRLRL